MRKIGLLLGMTLLLLVAVPAKAAAEARGSIQVRMDIGDMPVIHGAVQLHQVGVKTEGGYRITEAFGGGTVRYDDIHSDHLTQWLAQTADGKGMSLLLDADGTAVFSGLEEGLYLLVQTERIDGFYPIYPVLQTVPEGDCWDVSIFREPVPVVTEIPKTGESPLLLLSILGMLLSSAGLLLCARISGKQ